MEYKVEQVIKENRMYILNDEPFSLSVPEGVDTIFVPEGTAEGYKALNPTVSDYIKNYSYSNYRVTKPEFYDDVTIIMDKNTNAPVLSVMYAKGLCANENYMTLAEAKAVKNEDLPASMFENNLDVTSFMEFQYFTGITETPQRMFFGAYNLERIELPKTVKRIGDRMFTFTNAMLNSGYESKLSYVGGVENVEYVGTNAFQFTYNIKTLNFTKNLKTVMGGAFYGVGENKNNTHNRIDRLESLGDLSGIEEFPTKQAFDGRTALKGEWDLRKVKKVPYFWATQVNPKFDWDNIELFDPTYNIFGRMYGLRSVPYIKFDISKANSLFVYCFNLENVGNIYNNTTLPKQAFAECNSLKTVGDMSEVTNIGVNCFYNDYNLISIGNISNVVELQQQAFIRCMKLPTLGNVDSLTTIGEWALSNTVSLTQHFPNVNTVKKGAFMITVKPEHPLYTEETVDRVISFGLPYEEINFDVSAPEDLPFLNCTKVTIICNGVELTEEQYTTLGATKPNSETVENIVEEPAEK